MLAVAAELTVGDKLYKTHVQSLRLRRGLLPIVDRLDVRLPAGVQLDASPGDDVSLDLDGGDGKTTVFTGKLSSLARSLAGPRLTAHHGALLLGRYRPSVTLEQVTIGDVIKQLCGDVSVDTGDIEDGPTLALYVADGRSTALDEVSRLARLAGCDASFDSDGKVGVFARGSNGPGGQVALKYGRELSAVVSEHLLPDDSSRTVVGDGAGGPDSSLRRWPIVDFFSGGADDPGPSALRRAAPELRTVSDARAAGQAWSGRAADLEKTVRMRAWLLPALMPGTSVQLQELPDDVSLSAFQVSQVSHVIDARGAFTDVWGYEASGASGGGGLLGAAINAVGGLL